MQGKFPVVLSLWPQFAYYFELFFLDCILSPLHLKQENSFQIFSQDCSFITRMCQNYLSPAAIQTHPTHLSSWWFFIDTFHTVLSKWVHNRLSVILEAWELFWLVSFPLFLIICCKNLSFISCLCLKTPFFVGVFTNWSWCHLVVFFILLFMLLGYFKANDHIIAILEPLLSWNSHICFR